MNRIAIALTAALLGSSAAYAQYGPPPGGPRGYDASSFWNGAPDSPRERIQFLQERVDRGIADGSLDRHEAARVSREIAGVRQWIGKMHWRDDGPLAPDQRARVQQRLDDISRQIHWMRRNGR